MDTKKKPTKKLIAILGGGMVLICLCLAVIVRVSSPSDEVQRHDTQVARAVTQEIEPETTDQSEVEEQTEEKTSEPSRTQAPTKTSEPSRTPAPTNTPVPTQTPDPNLVEAGMYLVNTDIRPGIYRGSGSCYWERLKDGSGTFDAILANDNTDGQFYLEVKESDYAIFIDCNMVFLEKLPEPKDEFPDVYKTGMYLVGIDVLPGIYRGDESCYWERLTNVAGGFDAIIANDNTEGQFYVEIKESDYAFSHDCEIVPIEKLPEPTGEFPEEYAPGMYLLGRDMLHGTYQGEGSCYWERLRNVDGSFDAIIANDNTEGQFYVQLSESDFAFSTSCEVIKVED
jgi:hypothetical protein